jgi:ADP-ribosylglycohydrolase
MPPPLVQESAVPDIELMYPLLAAAGSEVGTGQLLPALGRAQGCLLGQLAGDSLGSLVEFEDAAGIRRRYPGGVRELADGGTFDTLAGQPTDDSEMALMLARSILREGCFSPGAAAEAYAHWFDSGPFDCGRTTARALRPAAAALTLAEDPANVAHAARTAADPLSQANGALMRVSPLGIFAHRLPAGDAAQAAREDARLTHPHPVCQDANAVFVVAIARAIASGATPEDVHRSTLAWAESEAVEPAVRDCLRLAEDSPPPDFQRQQGWVLIALRNAFWQLLHASDLEGGVCDTVMRGGDTDTNAAIAGALLGAVYGADGVPKQWLQAVLSCRPERGRPGVHQPRPKSFWPVDALLLAERLMGIGTARRSAVGER